MGRHILAVLTSPTPGMEDEFNDWYTNVHLPDVLKLNDFKSAQRFRFVAQRPDDKPLHRYLALYEVETDDVPATQRLLEETAGTPAMPFSPAIDIPSAVAWYYEEITEKLT